MKQSLSLLFAKIFFSVRGMEWRSKKKSFFTRCN